MRSFVSAFGPRTMRVVAIATLAGVAASCSNAVQLDRPITTGSTPNQKAIIGAAASQQVSAPAPTMAVSRTDLPPPSGVPAAPVTYPSPAAPLPNADGYAWTAVGGNVITVGASETLSSIAVKYGVPPSQILLANQLATAGDIRPGQILVIPRRVGITPETAPVQVAAARLPEPAAVPIATASDRYVVRSGDTLYSVARSHGVTVDAVVSANNLASTQINIGQALTIPFGAGAPPQAVASVAQQPQLAPVAPRIAPRPPQVVATANRPPVPAIPSIPVTTGPTVTPAVVTTAIDDADPPSVNGTTFRWPVRGRIVSGFGTKPNGERNDGINLSVPEGTSVKAVEAGTVIYAGNELEGYGNLILIRHADGWVSAYAHNKDLLVQRGDEIRRGETIAHAGMTGSVSAPQVHFELRQGSKPVNPLDYLTG